MPQNFLACEHEQSFLLPPDVREWLPENHLAWFVIDAVAVMDTAAFYAAYRDDGHGRAAYEPSMMLALVLYCWARGTRSSRAIERACVEDVAYRVIAAHQRPDHATIARFVERHERALAGVFGEVLALCADAGLASVGVIAIDGTKVHANANRDRAMDYEQIARAIVEEAVATDAAETAALGDRRGDELPEILTTRQGREGWLRDARQRLDHRRAREAAPIPRSRPERLREGKRRLDKELAVERDANAQYEAYRARGRMKDGRRFGRPPNPRQPPTVPTGEVNLTDPDSKLVHGMRGWVQGYNAQAARNERHLIVAAELMTASPDFGHLGPMVDAARRELAGAGVASKPDVVVADAGYWHLEQMNAITADGIPVLIPPDSSRRRKTGTRRGWSGGAYDFMRRVLETDLGSGLYKRRGQLIEPIFGHTKHNRGFIRFHRRGRAAARAEWRPRALDYTAGRWRAGSRRTPTRPRSGRSARRRSDRGARR